MHIVFLTEIPTKMPVSIEAWNQTLWKRSKYVHCTRAVLIGTRTAIYDARDTDLRPMGIIGSIDGMFIALPNIRGLIMIRSTAILSSYREECLVEHPCLVPDLFVRCHYSFMKLSE